MGREEEIRAEEEGIEGGACDRPSLSFSIPSHLHNLYIQVLNTHAPACFYLSHGMRSNATYFLFSVRVQLFDAHVLAA